MNEPVSPMARLKEIKKEQWKLCDERDKLSIVHLVQAQQDRINFKTGEYQGIKDSLSWFRWRLEKIIEERRIQEYMMKDHDWRFALGVTESVEKIEELLRELDVEA